MLHIWYLYLTKALLRILKLFFGIPTFEKYRLLIIIVHDLNITICLKQFHVYTISQNVILIDFTHTHSFCPSVRSFVRSFVSQTVKVWLKWISHLIIVISTFRVPFIVVECSNTIMEVYMSTYVSSLCTRTLQNPWIVGQRPSEDRLSTRRPHIVHSTSSIDGDTINNEQKFVVFLVKLGC